MDAQVPCRTAVIDATTGALLDAAGLPALERVLRTALRAGIQRAVILIPADADGPPPGAIRQPLPADLELVWLRAGDAPDEPEPDLAGDDGAVLFTHTAIATDPDHLKGLLAMPGDVVAAVAPLAPGQPLPGLGAILRAGRIVMLEPEAPARLAGSVRVPAELAPALLAESRRHGLPTALERQLGALAEAGRLVAFAPARGAVVTLDGSAAAAHAASAALVAAAAKPGDGLVARHLNRRVSGALTRRLLALPVTPNALSLVTLALGLVTAPVLAAGTHASFVLGTLLYHVNSTLDGCDGELARIRFQTSRAGEWLDTIGDQVGNLLFALAVPYGLWRRTGDGATAGLGLFIAVGTIVAMLAVAAHTRRTSGAGNFNDYGRSLARGMGERTPAGRVVAVIALLCRRDSYALLFFLLALAGRDEWVLYGLALGVAVHLLSLFLRPPAGARTAAASSGPGTP